jgi:hypothetical protein
MLACGESRGDDMLADGGSGGHDPESSGGGEASGGDPKLDVGPDSGGSATAGDGSPSCKVEGDLDAPPSDCEDQAPPDSFEPAVQWSWTAPENPMILATPLVANLTDDNGDGAIDLCDIPDVIVPAMKTIGSATLPSPDPSYIYVLDGATGQEHFKIEMPVAKQAQPVVGDVDGDGVVEIVAVIHDQLNTLGIWEHDGTLKLLSEAAPMFYYSESLALYDIDADGDVEIIVGGVTYDHEGNFLWYSMYGSGNEGAAPVAVDLDDDGMLEIVQGNSAFRNDGELYWVNLEVGDGGSAWADGYPQVANFDDDDDPEILLTNEKGLSMFEHDGTPIFMKLRPTGESDAGLNWARPAAVHDFDADGLADFAHGASEHFTVYRRDGSILWSQDIVDLSGAAAGTAFDFLGDGAAEAMYADEHTFYTFDGKTGDTVLTQPRLSRTLVEFPVVADIDNDGSAEVLVVSNETIDGMDDGAPALQAIRDVDDRWIPARRIWNQHQYHVTNVREDGTIPQVQQKHWLNLNTFRTQAQIGEGGLCKPPVEG